MQLSEAGFDRSKTKYCRQQTVDELVFLLNNTVSITPISDVSRQQNCEGIDNSIIIIALNSCVEYDSITVNLFQPNFREFIDVSGSYHSCISHFYRKIPIMNQAIRALTFIVIIVIVFIIIAIPFRYLTRQEAIQATQTASPSVPTLTQQAAKDHLATETRQAATRIAYLNQTQESENWTATAEQERIQQTSYKKTEDALQYQISANQTEAIRVEALTLTARAATLAVISPTPTPTPTSTASPSPTVTPTPTPLGIQCLATTRGRASLYQYPAIKHDILINMPNGSSVSVRGALKDQSWYLVQTSSEFDSLDGWLTSREINLQQCNSAVLPIADNYYRNEPVIIAETFNDFYYGWQMASNDSDVARISNGQLTLSYDKNEMRKADAVALPANYRIEYVFDLTFGGLRATTGIVFNDSGEVGTGYYKLSFGRSRVDGSEQNCNVTLESYETSPRRDWIVSQQDFQCDLDSQFQVAIEKQNREFSVYFDNRQLFVASIPADATDHQGGTVGIFIDGANASYPSTANFYQLFAWRLGR
ncbi:MAG: hypothetical protein JW725_00335 [Candidatus Babeliaceae bacterium]|nr:hypothetical protein [Candidatus Babeliaceae bacterium]